MRLLNLILKTFNCIDSLSVGCGKTFVAITTAAHILKYKPDVKVVIITTKSSWVSIASEFEELDLNYSTPESRDEEESYFLVQRSRLNKELGWFLKLAEKYKILLVVDEAHELANYEALQTKTVRALRAKVSSCIFLTGTPLLNHIEGFYNIINIAVPGFLGKQYEFDARYLIKEPRKIRMGGFSRTIMEIVGYKNLPELRSKLEKICMTRKISYDIETKFYGVDLDEELLKAYSRAARGVVKGKEDKGFAQRVHDLQQVVDASHPEYPFNKVSKKELKLLSIVENIVRKGESTIVYFEYLSTLARVTMVLEKYKKKMSYKEVLTIKGDVSMEGRKEIAESMGKSTILLMTRAGAQSLNLQAANHVVIYDMPFAVNNIIQCLGRITRMNTKHKKLYLHLVEVRGTIDTYKRKLIQDRLYLIEELFGDKEPSILDVNRIDRDNMKDIKRGLLWSIQGIKKGSKKSESE